MAQRVKRDYIPMDVKRAALAKSKGNCWYCWKPLSKSTVTLLARQHIDHVVPLTEGGTDAVGNLVVACPRCNTKKSNYSLTEWRLLLGDRLAERMENAIADMKDGSPIQSRFGDVVDFFAHTVRDVAAYLRRCGPQFHGECQDPEWSHYCI